MNTIRLDKERYCNNSCKNVAVYDSKTIYGHHGYLCSSCFDDIGVEPTTKLVYGKGNNKDKIGTCNVTELGALQDLMNESIIECPLCNSSTFAEPDASAVYCNICGGYITIVNPLS